MKVRARSLTGRPRHRAGYAIDPDGTILNLTGPNSEAAYRALLDDKCIEVVLVPHAPPAGPPPARARKPKKNNNRNQPAD